TSCPHSTPLPVARPSTPPRPLPIYNAQRGIAVPHLRHQHPHRTHIIDLVEVDALVLHLAPDRIDVLDPSGDIPLDTGLLQLMARSEEHTSELQSRENLVCRLLLAKK